MIQAGQVMQMVTKRFLEKIQVKKNSKNYSQLSTAGIAIEYGGDSDYPHGCDCQSSPGNAHHLCDFIACAISLYVLGKTFFF